MEKRYCACGCGGELKTWKNNRTSSFLRGHHMRKKGWSPPDPTKKHFCKCGCGEEIKPLPSGHVRDYIKGHHLKGKELDIEYRIQRTKTRWNKDPKLSPYIENTFITYDEKRQRWTACIKKDGKWKSCMHAYAVYLEHFGEIPKGYVVHHKNGKHDELEDDHPDNLMLLLDEWNLRFFPVLAKGFNVEENVVTECYLSISNELSDDEEKFSKICSMLIDRHRTNNE